MRRYQGTPVQEILGTRAQESEWEALITHVKAAKCLADLEPTLVAHSYNPPAGFYYAIIDPVSRGAVHLYQKDCPPLLWGELAIGLKGRDRWSQPHTGHNYDPSKPLVVGGEKEQGYYYIRDVPLYEVADALA